VFSLPPRNEGPEMAAEFLHWLAEESKLPGSFTPRGPREDAEAPGFASGYTMPAARGGTKPTARRRRGLKAAEKLAVIEWGILPDRRGMGIGRRLLEPAAGNSGQR
jgi:ribosomal protein S18 acetylase RimI-like enzyme